MRRRFVFGFTIEDTKMKLWFLSLADVFVSQGFDFTTVRVAVFHIVCAVSNIIATGFPHARSLPVVRDICQPK